jgi:hypothetical protein
VLCVVVGTGWVNLMLSDNGKGTIKSEAKCDHAYGFLVLEFGLAMHMCDLVWAFIMGALLHQVSTPLLPWSPFGHHFGTDIWAGA